MLENPLIRLFGSAIALANLPAIEIFGSIEQRPSPAIFVIVLVTRVDEILGHDVSRHFQSCEITVKLASHSLAGETAGCPKFSRDETAGRLRRGRLLLPARAFDRPRPRLPCESRRYEWCGRHVLRCGPFQALPRRSQPSFAGALGRHPYLCKPCGQPFDNQSRCDPCDAFAGRSGVTSDWGLVARD